MSIIQGNALEYASSPVVELGYDIPYSLRLRRDASAQLTRNITVAGDRQKWTWSGWVKRGMIGSGQYAIMGAGTASTTAGFLSFYFNADKFGVAAYSTGSHVYASTAVFRDIAAHYHIVLAFDSNAASAADRIKLYVNGVNVPLSKESGYPTDIPQNFQGSINDIGVNTIGSMRNIGGSHSSFFDGYISEINFIDGQVLPYSNFGEFNQTTGQWVAKKYEGTYGVNGFYLDFKDGINITALCGDKSGNSNNWTANNVNLGGSGVSSHDHMTDTPTNNYPVVNSLIPLTYVGSGGYTTNGNLRTVSGYQNAYNCFTSSTMGIPLGAKMYAELTCVAEYYPTTTTIGCTSAVLTAAGSSSPAGINVAFGAGDTIGVAVDRVLHVANFYKNGTAIGALSINPTVDVFFHTDGMGNAGSAVFDHNYGQQPFKYQIPSGYITLCTKNLPAPAIANPEKYFDVKTYLGNGGALQVGETQKAIDLVSIDHSLRFKRPASPTISSVVGTPLNPMRWTWSGWVKRTILAEMNIFSAKSGSDSQTLLFTPAGTLEFVGTTDGTGGNHGWVESSEKFLDTSRFYHIVVQYDGTVSTKDRCKIFVDGVMLDMTLGYGFTAAHIINSTGSTRYIGRSLYTNSASIFFDGYMADIHFVDGQLIGATGFGQWDANGYWAPATYSGTYGNTGYHLLFADGTSSSSLGQDSSGNSNNWSLSGFGIATGVANDWMIDTPTNNFATLNPMSTSGGYGQLSNGGLYSFSNANGYSGHHASTLSMRGGKWYAEVTVEYAQIGSMPGITYPVVGITPRPTPNAVLQSADEYSITSDGFLWNNAGGSSYGASYGAGDVITVAVDNVNGKIWFGKNGVWQGLGDPANGANPAFSFQTKEYWFAVSNVYSGSQSSSNINFGQRGFKYSPPAGFMALCENNIVEYTGDIETPDLVWIKSRSAAQNHMLFDVVRGVKKSLSSNTTDAEVSDENSLIGFNKNGFYIGSNANINTLNTAYVAWLWKANGPAVPNTDGTIQSMVSANPVNGVSIVKYTGTGIAGSTVGHGLDAAPKFVIIKNQLAALDWFSWHSSLPNGDTFIKLNSSDGSIISTGDVWTGTKPTSTVVSLGYNATVNASGSSHIAYCFAEVTGFSKFGTYQGNGSSDGAFVNLGFKPAFVMVKCISVGGGDYDWQIFDNARDIVNGVSRDVDANKADIEGSPNLYNIDFVSNGIKFRNTYGSCNGPNTYIYAAFAETPANFANAR